MSLQSGQHGERMQQPEAAAKLEVRKLKSADEVKAAIEQVGGENLLHEHGIAEQLSGDKGKWLQTLTSEIIDGKGFPLAMSADGKDVAVVIADSTGTITRLYSSVSDKEAVFKAAFEEMKNAGIQQPKIRFSREDEDIHKLLLHMGIRTEEPGGEDDRKITLVKD